MTAFVPLPATERMSPDPFGFADETEIALWRARDGADPIGAREQLFMHFAPFARGIARRHHRSRSMGDIDFADLQQLGYAGLIEAIDRFDPRRGTPFRAFAAPRISGSIMDGIDRMSEMREQMSWRKRVRRDRVRSLSPPEQDVDGLNEPDALAALADLAVGLALGFMLEGTGLVISDEDAAPNVAIGYESAEWMEVVDHLRAELGDLPRREQLILRHHYGGGVGFDQLAKLLDLSKARISQLHRAALDLLRKRLAARGHFRLER